MMGQGSVLLAGDLLDGKYRIVRLLGAGGMGAVYQAEHVGTGRTVAIKTMLESLVRDPAALERFRREARAAGGLRHPNIVDVTDFGVADCRGNQVAYLAMEYLEGTTLHDLIRSRGALPVDLVVAIVEQIALALDVAHRAGVVHRDLKPENVWLVPDPRGGYSVRVLDFGIAKVRDSAGSTAAPLLEPVAAGGSFEMDQTLARGDTPTTPVAAVTAVATPSTDRLTTAGMTLGTPTYMSPEQCRGEDVDLRSDIYALGIITYEAIAGRRPFEAPTLSGMIAAHLHEIAEPLDRVSAASGRVAAVVARALAQSPDERFESAIAMAGSLYAAAEGAGAIIRRSASLYFDQLGPFFRISWAAAKSTLAVNALLMLVTAFWPPVGAPFLPLVSILGWTFVTLRTNALFAVVVERIRTAPLDAVTPAAAFALLRERLGLVPDVSAIRLNVRLFSFSAASEAKSRAFAGDLAFLIRLIEGLPLSEVPARCDVLAETSTRSYTAIRMAILAALLLPLIPEAAVFSVIATLLHIRLPLVIGTVFACGMLPFNALFLNPVFSCALALQYFRARQANGEDVGLGTLRG